MIRLSSLFVQVHHSQPKRRTGLKIFFYDLSGFLSHLLVFRQVVQSLVPRVFRTSTRVVQSLVPRVFRTSTRADCNVTEQHRSTMVMIQQCACVFVRLDRLASPHVSY